MFMKMNSNPIRGRSSNYRGQFRSGSVPSRQNFQRNSHSERNATSINQKHDDKSFNRVYPIGVRVLESLLDREPFVISMELLKKNSGYDILLNENPIKDYKIELIIKLLYKSINSRANTEGSIDLLLQTFKNTNFCQNLATFVSDMKYEPERADECLSKIGDILSYYLRVTPSIAYQFVSNLCDLCIGVIQRLKCEKGNVTDHEEKFENLITQLKENRKRLHVSRKSGKKYMYVEPPDDFRSHNVLPVPKELNSVDIPFIRPNIIEGAYISSDHYLDLHFRLLKEDFVRPLREGLMCYKIEGENRKRSSDVRVYRNVKLESSGVDRDEVIYFLKLDLKKTFRVDNSKRFMFGNILCLSNDDFKTMTIASIASRDKLDEHLLGIKIESELSNLEPNKIYTVLESKAYFVSYKHTLCALQKLDDVPLKEYTVFVKREIEPPTYLKSSSVYDILGKLNFAGSFGGIPILRPLEYFPSCEELSLDESQRRALRGALTRKLSIIQGPPGTGKTFLGLKITKILLHNKSHWSHNSNPILVVCYTNHALDQFLEGMISFTNKIVRIGSQSKNESLKEFEIRNHMRNHLRDRDDNAISRVYWETLNIVRDLKTKIEYITKILENLKTPGIISLNSFGKNFNDIIPINIKSKLSRKGDNAMRDFLIFDLFTHEFFDEEAPEVLPTQYLHDNYTDHGDFDEHSELDIDEHMRKEEERDRFIEADEEELFEEGPLLTNLPHFNFDITVPVIKDDIFHLNEKVQKDPYNMNNREIYERIKILRYELRAINAGHVVPVSDIEYEKIKIKKVQDIDFIDRWKMYKFWVKKLYSNFMEMKWGFERTYMKHSRKLLAYRELRYLGLMKGMDIVGMTTTAAAQYCNLLHDLGPPIVIVEEAAEIMETHIITSLSTKCEHLILIGDHQQLKPKPMVYELGIKYNLETSFFERMILNHLPYDSLEYQHRMKPVISDLLVPTIYENLEDHPSVFEYPKIRGVAKDLFFLNHSIFENAPYEDAESFENAHEAEFMMGLCRHLLLQGYDPCNITILTPYSGQFRCFKRLQKKPSFQDSADVRVSILDNYQGEENDIILLSLVRSNEERKVGFVKIDNRICVALSRAKHAMYIIGNMSQMVEASTLWERINQKLLKGGNIGNEMELKCHNHPNLEIFVKSYDDIIQKSPEGGCRLPCSAVLNKCGHNCPRLCHIVDMDHSNVRCTVPCPNIICELGHKCPKLCFEECPPCTVPLQKNLPCNHTCTVPCSVKVEDVKCLLDVDKKLPHCGHILNLKCHIDESKYSCTYPCKIRLECGHQCKKNCHPLDDPNHYNYDCHHKCERNPKNCSSGHKCNKKCYEDCGDCIIKVSKNLKCGHTMKNIVCSVDESTIICNYKCHKILSCNHKCKKLCGEVCGGCMEEVIKMIPECQHKVLVPCSQTPDLKYCHQNCTKILNCGHACKNKCNETCTERCLELFQSSFSCPRGHRVKLPCYLKDSSISSVITKIDGKTVGEYCTETCGARLDCEHFCRSKCGKCLNGRLHESCKEKCGKSLVCGHICKDPCSADCPPCQEKCPWKCLHSECNRKCGIPCLNCKEKCENQCEHTACKKSCGDVCDRKPCTEPCKKTVLCGHPCIGFCGEPCPPYCRDCDKTLTEIFFGNEDDEGVRYIQIEDCGHVFESSALDQWMKCDFESSSESNKISMKECPKCKTAIYNTKRYQKEILESYKKVHKVKSKYFTMKKKIEMNRSQLLTLMKEMKDYWRDEIEVLRKNLGYDINFRPFKKQKTLSDQQYELYSFQLKFLKSARLVNDFVRKVNKLSLAPISYNYRVHSLVKRLMNHKVSLSRQAMEEYSCELRRIEICKSVERGRGYISNPEIAKEIKVIDTIMDPTIKFDRELEEKIIVHLKNIEKYTGSLGITNEERMLILKAMNLKQGHWYACPNGHIYCITECGGAMEESKCPECSADIGGTSHKLRSDNRVATEMDGARSSAWPGGAL